MENSALQAERMDEGERSSADALRRITELHDLEQQVALAVALGLGFWEWDVPTGGIRALGGTSPFLSAVTVFPAVVTWSATVPRPSSRSLLATSRMSGPTLTPVSCCFSAKPLSLALTATLPASVPS